MNTIEKRQTKQKELILEQLKKTPIVHVACEKTNVGRATFYRWKKESAEFNNAANEALDEGIKLMNDFAESKVLSAIQDGNLTAAMYWLNHRHSAYGNKLEVSAGSKEADETLTPEQQAVVKKALVLTGIVKDEEEKSDH